MGSARDTAATVAAAVRARASWRWPAVAAGVAILCALPVLASALPVSVPALTAAQLRDRIVASAGMSYSGYAESNATFGLPPLSGLSSVTSLLDGVTKMRVWQAAPDRWRVDVLSDAGERDTYQLGTREFLWNSGAQLTTEVLQQGPGQPGIRLPRAADLVPTALAQRVLDEAGPAAKYSTLPPVRVAGRSAVGLRVTPGDPDSTIGQIDIWAVPSTGLPLMVEVFGRGARTPALQSQFFQVGPWQATAGVLTPPSGGPGTGFTVTSSSNLAGVLKNLEHEMLPETLAGRRWVPPPGALFSTVGLYGGGLSTFAVLTLRAGTGSGLMDGARSAGGTPYSFPDGTGVLISASLVNAVIAQSDRSADTFIITGTVSGTVLLRAAVTLTSTMR